LEKLILENADIPEAFNLFAQILSEQEDYEKADKFYKNALEKDPKNAALMVQHALSIMSWRNDFEEPIKILNEAIKIDETCEFAYETLATIEIQRLKIIVFNLNLDLNVFSIIFFFNLKGAICQELSICSTKLYN
jgi:import receptor subunit TOM70